jgi:antitoxin ParD1/3/4
MPMTTMNISLPEPLKNFVDRQVQDGGYSTSSEYVRDLIRGDQVRRAEQQLATLIMEGLESGSAILADDNYWKNKRAALKQRHEG